MRRSLLALVLSSLAFAPTVRAHGDNLLENHDFDANVDFWSPSNPVTTTITIEYEMDFDRDDALSGSARVTSTQLDDGSEAAGPGMAQCVAVEPDTDYVLSGSAYVPSSQNRAALPDFIIVWFETALCGNCPPENLDCFLQDAPTPQHDGALDAWRDLEASYTSPADAMSARVIARPRKQGAAGMVDVLFDAISLPEPGAGAMGVSAAASLALLARRRSGS